MPFFRPPEAKLLTVLFFLCSMIPIPILTSSQYLFSNLLHFHEFHNCLRLPVHVVHGVTPFPLWFVVPNPHRLNLPSLYHSIFHRSPLEVE